MKRLLCSFLHGRHEGPSTFLLGRWLFLRLLALVFLIAFLSYWSQLDGLIGSRGVLPASDYFDALEKHFGKPRLTAYPSLCWISASDGFLHALCAAGTVLSLLLVAGVAPLPALVLLWLLYLSLVVAGQTFFTFQWDVLLLETAFTAMFVAPLRLRPRFGGDAPPTPWGLFLLRWLLFKLMFLSGATKLLSGDETWWSLTALPVHYETQPIPTWTAWYAFHLPEWFHELSQAAMFVIEVGVPFLVFAPRIPRHLAAGAFIFLQVAIAATGNYTFFNLLTIVLCIPLLDDAFLCAALGRLPGVRRLLSLLEPRDPPPPPARRSGFRLSLPLALAFFAASVVSFLDEMARTHQSAERVDRPARFTGVVDSLLEGCEEHVLSWSRGILLEPVRGFRTINGYGLFRSMTTERPEIVVEGSRDGVEWQEYAFPWKPGTLDRAPGFVAPHQPRLDWQMWFAALSPRHQRRWLQSFLRRVLEGSEDVLALLETNPFPDAPPRYVRLVYYDYEFTSPEAGEASGNWWRRERKGVLAGPLSLPERR